MVKKRQTIWALARTCLLLALAGVVLALDGCAPASGKKEPVTVKTVTVVAAVQAPVTPVEPAVEALPPTATNAPATATPPPPMATRAEPAAAAVQPTATNAPAAPVAPAPLGAPGPSPAGSPVAAPAVEEAPPIPTATATASTAPAASGLAGIQVSYRLDPWMIAGSYGGGFWVSPPVLGPTTQGGSTFVLEVRAQGLTTQGAPAMISPEWIPADTDMVSVSPPEGNDVVITVQRAGQTSLQVVAQGVSKTLSITAVYQGSALLLSISQ